MLIGLLGSPGAGRLAVSRTLARLGWRGAAFGDSLLIEVSAAWAIDQGFLTNRRHHDATTPQLAVGNGNSRDWLEWAAIRGHNLMQPRSPAWALEQWAAFRRAGDPQWWVRPVAYWIRLEQQQAERRGAEAMLAITDCAPGITSLAVRAMGGYLLRVHRPALAGTVATAPARLPQIAADDDIVNDGTLADLDADVMRVLRGLQARERLNGLRGENGSIRGTA